MMTAVPFAVPCPLASRHLLPNTWSCRPVVTAHRWLACGPQSNNCTWVPLVVALLGTSTHRPDWPPTICCPPPDGVAEGVGPPPGWNCAKKFQTTALVQVRSPPPLSAVDPSTGAGV